MRILRFLLLAITIYSQASLAGFLPEIEKPVASYDLRYMIFLHPNEQHPHLANRILSEAGPGVYISVGTERSFLGASRVPNLTHLLVIDLNPNVILYVRLNTILLKISRDREDYLRLRRFGSHEEWQARGESVVLSAEERRLWADPEILKWWQELIRSNKYVDFYGQHPDFFSQGIYVKSDEHFRRLQNLARLDRISAVQLRLEDKTGVDALVRALKKAKIKLSVLDISNSWFSEYLPDIRIFPALFRQFAPVVKPESIFMVTCHSARYKVGWDYFGVTFDRLLAPGGAEKLANYLRVPNDSNRTVPVWDANQLNPGVFADFTPSMSSRVWGQVQEVTKWVLQIPLLNTNRGSSCERVMRGGR